MCNCPKRVKEYLEKSYQGNNINKDNLSKDNFLVVLIEMILNYERMLNEYRFELYAILKDYPEILHLFYFNARDLREYLRLISFRVIKKEIGNDIQVKYFIKQFSRKFFI